MGSQELPSDVIFEILTRASLTTLDACKAVCKSWKQLTYDPSFMPLYCNRTKNLSGFLLQTTLNACKYPFAIVSINQSSEEEKQAGQDCVRISFDYDDMKILASSDQGICCCLKIKYRKYRYYVCKPVTQQFQALPNPKLRYETAGVAIMVSRSRPLRYKIVRLSKLPFDKEPVTPYMCEIFDSKSWRWRKTEVVNLPYEEFLLPSQAAVCIAESVYWLTNKENVLKFDAFEERFDLISFPEVGLNYPSSNHDMFEHEGRLGLITRLSDDRHLEIWQLVGSEWTRKMSIDIRSFQERVGYANFMGLYSSEAAFLITSIGEAIFCRLKEDQFCIVAQAKIDDMFNITRIFQFRSDLEMVNLKGGR